ncbi:hypothetical protein LTS07_001808 [Exophiala sideris]|uniref:Peptidase A1 domain-containing protein n=1 Tax=Exophiala sideris TaxID=1016849 RepID=A0ABR0JPC9_9EURO|nr:hypothetical protein LTS07_001808 [Exophiala sideris]KAK5044322.1 hypothetical protein LTR13_000678 [Exophiala sideris]KAK5067822.1 hypothetical protein LTR69_001811 [Exophiala sideris]
MAIATSADSRDPYGILGLGYDTLESWADDGQRTPYKNLLDQMVEQQLIDEPIFSLWLDDLGASHGVILFGGVDNTRYTGELVTLPVVPPESGIYNVYAVEWTYLGFQTSNGETALTADTFSVSAVLDSGTDLTWVPTALMEEIVRILPLTTSGTSSTGVISYTVPCSAKSDEGSFSFGFPGGLKVAVPIAEMVLPWDGDTCLWGMSAISSGFVLGDTFLRSAYVVYDQGNNEIGLAQSAVV